MHLQALANIKVKHMKHNILSALILIMTFQVGVCYSQVTKHSYDLGGLLRDGKLVIGATQSVKPLTDGTKGGVSCIGAVWLKGVDFKTGSIDVDMRGKDVFQQSFLGIAFYGVDTAAYDVIYFRPFNFQSPDSLRRSHAVQYMSEPNYPWDKLRAAHPLVYENMVNPAPLATAWFHARIVVKADEIVVYVDHSATPSLTVKKLNNRQSGLIGLWSSGLPGDFANLVIN
jgi:hypothetical protein